MWDKINTIFTVIGALVALFFFLEYIFHEKIRGGKFKEWINKIL